MEELVESLKHAGYNVEVEISEMDFEDYRSYFHITRLSLASFLFLPQRAYRDTRGRDSVHLKDVRKMNRDEDFIAELERYNPERYPIRHAFIDFPGWMRRKVEELHS
ncbi:MAG: hypothetical protein ACI8Z7_000664 [Candidatus Nanohaloarchaea archaeon]|jgi:hypothetical protein